MNSAGREDRSLRELVERSGRRLWRDGAVETHGDGWRVAVNELKDAAAVASAATDLKPRDYGIEIRRSLNGVLQPANALALH